MNTEPDQRKSPCFNSSSRILVTEGNNDEGLQGSQGSYCMSGIRKGNHVKSHTHLAQNKVTFGESKNEHASQNWSPNQKKTNNSCFNENHQKAYSEANKSTDSSFLNESLLKQKGSIILNESMLKSHDESLGSNILTELKSSKEESEDSAIHIIKDNKEKKEHKIPSQGGFKGLTRFKTALASKNPFFLSGLGFSALVPKDSKLMFKSCRSLKSSIKFSKTFKEASSTSQTLFHLPVEKPLLSKEDLVFIEKMMINRSEEHMKILNANNENESLKRKSMDINLDGQEWEISEYNSKDFNLDNVYKNFLIEMKPKLLLPIKSSSESLEDSKKSNILDSVVENNEVDEKSATIKRKTNHLAVPLTSRNTPHKKHSNFTSITNEDIAEFLRNSFYEKGPEHVFETPQEDEMLRLNEIIKNCRKFEEILTHNIGVFTQETIENPLLLNNPPKISSLIDNIRLHVCIKIADNAEKETFAIGKLSFTLTQSGLFLLCNQSLEIDFSGTRLVKMIINHQSKKDVFQGIWQNNKLYLPQEHLVLGENTLTFLTGTDSKLVKNPFTINDLSMIFPMFRNYEKNIDLLMTWIYPKTLRLISCLPEIFIQKLEDFEVDPDLDLKDFLVSKLRCKQANKTHGFIFGNFEEILITDAFNFYCHSGFKKIFIKKSIGLSDVLRLAEAFFNSYFKSLQPLKTNLKLVFVDQKAPIKVFQGLVLLKSTYMTRDDKFPEFLYLLLKLLLREIFIGNDIQLKSEYIWVFHGLSGFLILHFFEKPISSSFEIPIKEIKLILIQGKAAAIQQNLLKNGTHSLTETGLDRRQRDDSLNIYKSLYFFKQLAAYISKKGIHEVLMELDYKNFSIKMFLEKIEPFLRENELVYFKKWLSVWLCGLGVQEIEFEIHANPQRPLFLNELIILQRPVNWTQGSNDLNYHFLAFSLVNNAGISQFTLDIVIPNTSESCIIDKIKGKYVPKALILDPDDNGYFLYQFDIKTKAFLWKNVQKLNEMKMRANCYNSFYIDSLINRFNIMDFFDMAVRGLETESEFVLLKALIKYCKNIYRALKYEDWRRKLFKYFISAMEAKKFSGREEFFFGNAVFYCKNSVEFEALTEVFENLEKPHGFLPYISYMVKFLWKRTLFISFRDEMKSEDMELKNLAFISKFFKEYESELSKQIYELYQNLSKYIHSGVKVFYDKILEIFSCNSLKNNQVDFESLHLGAQILEEFALCFKIEEIKDFQQGNELIYDIHHYEEEIAWEILKPLLNFIEKTKLLKEIKEKSTLKRLLGELFEIEERLKISLNLQRLSSL